MTTAKHTIWNYSTGSIPAVLVDQCEENGKIAQVLEANGRFFIKVNGMQVGVSYCARNDATSKAFAVVYLSEHI